MMLGSEFNKLHADKELYKLCGMLKTVANSKLIYFATADTLMDLISFDQCETKKFRLCEIPDDAEITMDEKAFVTTKLFCGKVVYLNELLESGKIPITDPVSVLRTNYELFKWMPKSMKTIDVCIEAIYQCSHNIKYVEPPLLTNELCEFAVANDRDGKTIKYIPEDLLTKKICVIAVQRNFAAFKYLSKDMKVHTITVTPYINTSSNENNMLLQCMYISSVVRDGMTLQYVPEASRDEHICKAAVDSNWMALQFVPDHLRTYDICHDALQQDEDAITFMPEEIKNNFVTDPKMVELVMRDGRNLKLVPEEKIGLEVALRAIQNDASAMHYVPDEMRRGAFIEAAARHNWQVLKYLTDEEKTFNVCLAAIKLSEDAYEYVPDEMKTNNFNEAAASHNWQVIKYLRDEDKTIDICLAAIKLNDNAFDYVPDKINLVIQMKLWLANGEKN